MGDAAGDIVTIQPRIHINGSGKASTELRVWQTNRPPQSFLPPATLPIFDFRFLILD